MFRLSEAQAKALAVLTAGGTGAAAAKAAGVLPQQVSRWKRLPAFVAALGQVNRSVVDEVLSGIRPLLGNAISAVQTCLTNGSGPVRLKAAEMVFDQIYKGVEAQQLLGKIEELEGIIRALESGEAAGESDGQGLGAPLQLPDRTGKRDSADTQRSSLPDAERGPDPGCLAG